MAVDLLNSCGYSLQKIKRLYIASRNFDGSTIHFPIDYTTISGTSDSIIRVNDWNDLLNTCKMGGQELEWREVSVDADSCTYEEEYQETKQGKLYVKKLSFSLPKVNYTTNAALKEFLFTADGEFAVSKAIAFIIDENNQQWVVGYAMPLILQSGMELGISQENYYKLSFESISISRARNYQIEL